MPSPPKHPTPTPVPAPLPALMKEPSPESPTQAKPRAGKVLYHGLKVTASNWPCVLYGSLLWLTGALAAAILPRLRLAAGASPVFIGLPHSFNSGFFATRFRELPALARVWLAAAIHAIRFHAIHRHTIHLHAAGAAVLALALLGIVLAFVLAAGSVHLYLGAEPTHRSVPVKRALPVTLPVRRGITYLWPFLRVGFLGALIAGAILAALIAGWFLLLAASSRSPGPVAVLGALVLVLAAFLLRLWLDLAESYAIKRAMRGNKQTRRSLIPAFKTLASHFVGVVPPFFLAGLLGAGLLVTCLFFSKNLLQAHRIWPSLAVAAFGFVLLPVFRFWQRGMGAVLPFAVEPGVEGSVKPAAAPQLGPQLEPRAEPQAVCAAGREEPQPEKLPAEPTLQELVKKLENEPWASHAQATAYDALLFPPSQPGKSKTP